MNEISASVLNADFSKRAKWLPELEKARVDRLHWDFMDNKYVPNTGIDSVLMQEMRPKTKIFFESHLMVFRPETHLKKLAESGSQLAIFHVETVEKPRSAINRIHSLGMEAGICVNNKTPADKILPYLGKVELALVMSVEAGFGGQKFNHAALEKISVLRKKIDAEGFPCLIEVDGGIDAETGAKCVKAGADILAAGTFIFGHPKGIAEAARELRGK